MLDANEAALADFMRGEDATHNYSIALERAEAEIAADLMSVGYCNAQNCFGLVAIEWSDFLLDIDERGQWDILEANKHELFAAFCKEWAPYRVEFLES